MKYVIMMVCLIIFSSCTNKPPVLSEKERLANEVIRRAAIRIHKETGLIPCGTGGRMMDQIKKLNLAFDCYKEIDIEQARALLIISTEIFKEEVNFEPQIQKHLDQVPFEAKNIDLIIYIKQKDGSSVEKSKLCVTAACQGTLEFMTSASDGFGLITIHEETYEEALQKLEEQKPEMKPAI